ncbi:uncharacterized protein LOC135092129 [Scylla paramamosain]|uniref:uncharacterized protein LOC135092129 n=1 Tax=Scylla paramamosain TaxID=85552 RepID=UPI0030831FD2
MQRIMSSPLAPDGEKEVLLRSLPGDHPHYLRQSDPEQDSSTAKRTQYLTRGAHPASTTDQFREVSPTPLICLLGELHLAPFTISTQRTLSYPPNTYIESFLQPSIRRNDGGTTESRLD